MSRTAAPPESPAWSARTDWLSTERACPQHLVVMATSRRVEPTVTLTCFLVKCTCYCDVAVLDVSVILESFLLQRPPCPFPQPPPPFLSSPIPTLDISYVADWVLKVVVCGHCPVTLSQTINETLKWLSSLLILVQESFWW